ncbi:hypothetical protein HYX14_01260 [Candidatus Woesearchaeota archaeon]|nr:hypothetical protein [Candidatus Woesearchaeota archaeon]
MKLNKLLLVLVLSLPLVLGATTVDTDKDIYAPGETAIISGVCSTANLNVGLQVLLGANAVWVDEAKSDATKKYSKSFLPSQKGKYTAYAACTGDAAANAAFCVGTQDECAPKIAEKEEPKPSSGSGGGSGGGCTPVYVCGDWGFCNASLQQKRICTDQIACKSNKIEVQSCPKCQESWVCSLWSDCTGSQSRTTELSASFVSATDI